MKDLQPMNKVKTDHLTFETFSRSNQDTCLSQRPLMSQGSWVGKGQPLADSINSKWGDLSLGKNVLVAYMPWEGYNFEDSIVISDRLIADDVYTSLHIIRFRIEIRKGLGASTWPTSSLFSQSKDNVSSHKQDPTLALLSRDLLSCALDLGCAIKGDATLSSRGLLRTAPPLVTASAPDCIFDACYAPPKVYDSKAQQSVNASKIQAWLIRTNNKEAKPNTHAGLYTKGAQNRWCIFDAFTTGESVARVEKLEDAIPSGLRALCLAPLVALKIKTKQCCPKDKKVQSKQSVHSVGEALLRARSKRSKTTKQRTKTLQQFKTIEPGILLSQSITRSVNENGTTDLNFLKLSDFQAKASQDGIQANLGAEKGTKNKGYTKNVARQVKAIGGKVTELSGERLTRRIPFLGKNLLSHLDTRGIVKIGTWVSPGDVLVGKVRPLTKSARASAQLAWEIMANKKNGFGDNGGENLEDTSFRMPKGIFGRVIKAETINQVAGEQIHVYLAIKRKIQVGDKLAGRHGNKGIVSLVLPRQDMPYLANGTPIDLILSPLGVPSRMNVGQIYECLLGLAAKSLSCHFKVGSTMTYDPNLSLAKLGTDFVVRAPMHQRGARKDRWSIEDAIPLGLEAQPSTKHSKLATNQRPKSVHGKTSYAYQVLDSKQEEQTKPQASLFKEALIENFNGQCKPLVSFAIQQNDTMDARNLVFLKLYEARLIRQSSLLFSSAYPGKMRLLDGRTGQPFASWITVGYAYMLKLIHLVDTKMHSRSTGPYSLITRQPVTGKARRGGQRIGEMEAWALEGFGAAYTLQEFFSHKGDDVSSRHQKQVASLSRIVGNTTSFKTLLSELRALCVSLHFTGYTNQTDS